MIKSLLIWLGTIIVLILILYSKTHNTNWSNIEFDLLILDVLVGILAWAVLVSTFDRFLHKKYSNLKATLLSLPFLLATLIAGIAIILFFITKFSINNQLSVTDVKEQHYNLINSGLKIGSTGDDVKILQVVLAQDKNIYPSSSVSGYYGNLTMEAVINFQKKYSVNQSGVLDEETTNKFNEIYGNNSRGYYLSKVPITVNNYTNTVNTNSNSTGGENYKMRPDEKSPAGFFIMDNVPAEKMSTVDELNTVMNNYRRANGKNELNINSEICKYADQRAHEIVSVFNHNSFNNHVSNGDYRSSGFSWFNENIWQGYFSGVHIVEYGWDRSEGHRHTQLDNWNSGCAGIYDKYVSFIFAK